MKAEILDKDKYTVRALNLLGYKIDSKDVEVILNIFTLVQNNRGATTIDDIVQKKAMVDDLYKP